FLVIVDFLPSSPRSASHSFSHVFFIFFSFTDTATTEIYTLSLHDALPILVASHFQENAFNSLAFGDLSKEHAITTAPIDKSPQRDRKSTRLNSSHVSISYAVFCLKKKKMIPKHSYNLSR